MCGGILMERKTAHGEIMEYLGNVAFGKSNDCVKLTFIDENSPEIDTLDLTMLSELKRSASGGIEIKLLSRLDAMKLMLEASEEQREVAQEQARTFFSALNEGAAGNGLNGN